MITAAGAGASFCLATPARLRPQNQRNPRLIPAGHPSQASLVTFNSQGHPLQRTVSAASHYSQVSTQGPGSTYAPSIVSPKSDRIPEVSEVSRSRPFFPGPLSSSHSDVPSPSAASIFSPTQPVFRSPSFSASSAALYHETLLGPERNNRPHSPNSIYSYMSASSDQTARPQNILENLEPEELSDDDAEISPTSPAAPRQFQTYMTSPLPGLPSHVHNSQLDLQGQYSGNLNDLALLQSTDSLAIDEVLMKDQNSLSYSLDQGSQEICIVVLGLESSGKSYFIQNYNGSKSLPINGVSQRAYRLNNLRYVVRLVEMDMSALDIRNNQLTWPTLHDGSEIMTADGILVLFDITNPSSMESVPDVLDFFFRAEIPTLLVASKCDAPVKHRHLGPDTVEHLKHSLGVEIMETATDDGGLSQKRCVSLLLSNIIQRKAEIKATSRSSRRRANSSTYSARSVSPRSEPKNGHNRASSEISISSTLKNEELSESSKARGRTFRSKSASNTLLSPTRTSHSTPASPMTINASYRRDFNPAFGKETVEEGDLYLDTDPSGTYNPMHSEFLRSKSTSATSPLHQYHDRLEYTNSLGEVLVEHDASQRRSMDSDKYQGVNWEDLVDRLLAYPMSKLDTDFQTILLCFYRKFAAPVDLLNSILMRFDRVELEQPLQLLQLNEKVRILSKLHTWVLDSPGDFADPTTRNRALEFARSLEGNRTFAGMSKDIIHILSSVPEDVDIIWGKKDTDTHRISMPSYLTINTTPRNSSVISSTSYKSTGSDETTASLASPIERLRKESHVSISPSLDAGTLITMHPLIDSLPQMSPQTIREQFSFFMEISDEEIAHELTRIDWSLFSRIKPRDIVRYVSVPTGEKDRMKSLKWVNKLIRHFNHVAYWVASIILERPKPKHRARALEKFMNVAWILRHMNNYNSLGAVIAGVNGAAIHRLGQTRSLVNENVHKNFMRLELLMGTHKSHFSYRLALQNTTTEHIPFIPLHQRDLVHADDGNRSFVEDGHRINWRKFEVMGDILLTLTNSQAAPHKDLRSNVMINQLIYDSTSQMNDDQLVEGFRELYERSIQLEPGLTHTPAEMQRAKRGWFKR